jgi:acyl-CoA thioester hydrolase
MTPVHERTFRVRHYECDMYGHVNHANYLRYMQEAAFDASAAVGYSLETYQALGRYWLIRDTDVEYLSPLRFGDTVRVKTWVVDFRRVRSRRAYEFYRVEDGELVARAQTDWVFLEQATGRPATVPPEMVTAFLPAGPPAATPHRDPFPEPPAPPEGVLTHRQHVVWRDIDPAQHVNNAAYLAYMEDASVQTAAHYGWSVARMMDVGFAIVARRYRIEYRQPALLGDELEVITWVSDVKRATAIRHYTITRPRDGERLARAYALWVWVDLQTGRPMRVPANFMADFAPNIVP